MKIYIPMSIGYEGIEKIYGYFDEDHKNLAERIGKTFNVPVYVQELNQFNEADALNFLEKTGLHEYSINPFADEEISLTVAHDVSVYISNTLSLMQIEGRDVMNGYIWATSKEHAQQEVKRLQKQLEAVEFDDTGSKFVFEYLWRNPIQESQEEALDLD